MSAYDQLSDDEKRDLLTKLSRKLSDDGKLIEAGWIGLRLAAMPLTASAEQIEEMRNAFFAGAHYLFGSIMTVLDPQAEVTDADLDRMDKINLELQTFITEFKAKHGV